MTLPRRTVLAGALALTAAPTTTACSSGGNSPSFQGTSHLVKTAMGDVRVKEHPQRVVVLDTAELDSAITLGVRPVGATHTDVASGFLDYLPRDGLAGIKDVGAMTSPNLESVAALKPDLILTSKVRHGAAYAQLKEIAPTVMTESTGYPWKENFQLHALALGKVAEAKRVTDAYGARVREVTARLGGPARAAALKVNVVRFVEGADIRIYGRRNYIATLLDDVGLGRPSVVDRAKDGFSYDVSPERIDLADADVIFYATYGDPAKAKRTRTLSSALWKGLPAVRAGRVHAVDDELWIQGIGYGAAGRVLTDLSDLLPH
ncbi:ABC transporter substrate-binding protein [Streptomyces sp. NPDC001691]|uniref:ABC transporter substrate-binding protein n=1 Tax=unclassified Streptomyces TaxID=2593676 RepID=UPI000DE9A17B|nr:iron-siderophore ABC transporter substrate-binding protein [Streptomyces sp. SDr-06]RCH66048.1 iron-siderophore ABC transporter substrate-binding protein [Streptomyces sp. SDr-06]